jgi:hypothetical protein
MTEADLLLQEIKQAQRKKLRLKLFKILMQYPELIELALQELNRRENKQ